MEDLKVTLKILEDPWMTSVELMEDLGRSMEDLVGPIKNPREPMEGFSMTHGEPMKDLTVS